MMSLSKLCISPISWYTEVLSGFHKGASQSCSKDQLIDSPIKEYSKNIYFVRVCSCREKRRGEKVNVHAVPFLPFKFCQQKLSMSMELPESLYIFYDTGIKMETPRIITALAKTNYAWVEMGLNPPYLRGAHIHIYLMTPDVACKWHNLKKISGSAF